MKVSLEQQNSVISLPGNERYEYFIKKIVDAESTWGLYQDGWALAASDDGTVVFPFWPSIEYAQICAVNEWKNFTPKKILLAELQDIILPKLNNDGVVPGIFYTPFNKGVIVSVVELANSILTESRNYS